MFSTSLVSASFLLIFNFLLTCKIVLTSPFNAYVGCILSVPHFYFFFQSPIYVLRFFYLLFSDSEAVSALEFDRKVIVGLLALEYGYFFP